MIPLKKLTFLTAEWRETWQPEFSMSESPFKCCHDIVTLGHKKWYQGAASKFRKITWIGFDF